MWTRTVHRMSPESAESLRMVLGETEDLSQSLRCHIDRWVDWDTCLVPLGDSDRFVFMHAYVDRQDTDTYLVEGRFEAESMKVERMYYRDDHNKVEFASLAQMIDRWGEIRNTIPFTWTMDELYGRRVAVDHSHRSGRTWGDAREIVRWFDGYIDQTFSDVI